MLKLTCVLALCCLAVMLYPQPSETSLFLIQEFYGDAAGDELGYAVTEAGNLNGDGYRDWAIGAPYSSPEGGVYVYFGSPIVDNIRDLTLVKEDCFGQDLDTAGDVKDDGYDDLLARRTICGNAAYVFYGGCPMDSISDKTLSSEPYCGDAGTAGMGTAGDFDDDGYSDVIVGISSFFSPGWVELYCGGIPFDENPDVIFGPGHDCTGGGDVNGDPYSDVAVGRPYVAGGTGEVYVFLGVAEPDSQPEPDVVLEIGDDAFGSRIAFAGDVNGDSFDDLMVSTSTSYDSDGDVYVYYCSPGMDTLPDLIIPSTGDTTGFGYVIEPLGDINGDTYADIAVGAPRDANQKGRVYIYHGGDPMDNVADIVIEGETTGDGFGFAIAGLGDVNGDGDLEILVGAPGYDEGRGKAYMYAGCRAVIYRPDDDMKELVGITVRPNPFTSQATITWSMASSSHVTMETYDLAGRFIKRLIDAPMPPGVHAATWDGLDAAGRTAPSGIYFVRLSFRDRQMIRKVALLR
jgi:hypothetical protein